LQSTEAQREAVKAIRIAKHEKAEAKALKKAKRRKKEYTVKEYVPLPETDVDFNVSRVDSGTKEHFYGVAASGKGSVYVVGVSSLLKISANTSKTPVAEGVDGLVDAAKKVVEKIVSEETPVEAAFSVEGLKPAEGFPLPYIWMGGVDVTPSGDIWAAGIRGLIAKGSANDMTFGMKLNIAAPGAVKLVSSRWGEK
ncbi:MAG: glycosyl hydrolase, partial [Cycloclasticus sp.]|nr:glycosyl hydrolase [Cycloclasticus sp.]